MMLMLASISMTRVRKFLRLQAADRSLLVRAVALHTCVALLLRFVRFGRLSDWLRHWSGRPRASALTPDPAASGRIVRAVRQAASVAPWGRTCLTEALTAAVLLRRAGCDATLRYGVVTGGENRLAAHAWLEHDGVVIIGNSSRFYEPLTPAARIA
jgi:hypothetical protein